MTAKYALIGALVLIGAFAFVKRDFVVDAFHWDPKETGLPIPAFDPVARTQQLTTPPPAADAVRVAQPPAAGQNGLVGLAADPAAAAAAVPLTGGTASLSGTVVGPSGAVANATVHIERLVGDQVGALDVTTDASGAFSLPNALGGRYRVRAWQAPVMAQMGSEVTFVSDGEAHAFSLQLTAPSGRDVEVDWSSGGWVIGGSPSVSVVVTEPYVNDSGQVDLRGSGGLNTTLSTGGALAGGGSGTTGADGGAGFTVRCASVGAASATLTVGSYVRVLQVPNCSPPPTTTTRPPTTTTTQPGVPGQPGQPGQPVQPTPTPAPTPSTEAPPTSAAPTTTAG